MIGGCISGRRDPRRRHRKRVAAGPTPACTSSTLEFGCLGTPYCNSSQIPNPSPLISIALTLTTSSSLYAPTYIRAVWTAPCRAKVSIAIQHVCPPTGVPRRAAAAALRGGETLLQCHRRKACCSHHTVHLSARSCDNGYSTTSHPEWCRVKRADGHGVSQHGRAINDGRSRGLPTAIICTARL
ncbi:hypothetical protein BDY21DRAFT_347291 [Lineolata rhizophorae]|uniref:Uncharacterized protein n=1 Tax=Lineolata rhizophorae TaxID=578093 RepID=A0A6A6NXP6_9PEZI|nr:hypothetical protein BDY21DRAFT_347291 [Lineolata rhizophorae]